MKKAAAPKTMERRPAPRRSSRDRVGKRSRNIRRSYTRFCRRPSSVRRKSLNSLVIEVFKRESDGVCDNLSPTARKLLILKERDVRVV